MKNALKYQVIVNNNIKVLLIIQLIFLISCKGKTVSEEQISLEDYIGVSDSLGSFTDNDQNDSLNVLYQDTLPKDQLISGLLSDYDTSLLTKSTIFDRFSYSSKRKILLSPKDSLIENIELYMYHFKDSIGLNNALFNWLDCFGEDCLELQIGIDTNQINSKPIWCEISDTTIIFIQANKQPIKKNVRNAISDGLSGSKKYSFIVDHKNRIKWF